MQFTLPLSVESFSYPSCRLCSATASSRKSRITAARRQIGSGAHTKKVYQQRTRSSNQLCTCVTNSSICELIRNSTLITQRMSQRRGVEVKYAMHKKKKKASHIGEPSLTSRSKTGGETIRQRILGLRI